MEYWIAALLLVLSFSAVAIRRHHPRPDPSDVMLVRCPRCERAIFLSARKPGLYTCACDWCARRQPRASLPGGMASRRPLRRDEPPGCFTVIVFADGEVEALYPEEDEEVDVVRSV